MLDVHPPKNTPHPWRSVWRLLGLLLSVYVIVSLTEYILWDSHHLPGAGTIGAEQAQFATALSNPPGFVTVTSIAKGSPLDHAGVVPGDRLRFNPVFDYLRYRHAGETVHAIVDHAGQRRSLTLVAVPLTGPPNWDAVRFYLADIIPAIFGAFILWRSRGRAVALLLGAALITFAPPTPLTAMMWEGGRGLFLFSATLNTICVLAVTVFLLAFAMRFVDETVGGIGRREWIGFWTFTPVTAAILVRWCVEGFNAITLPLPGNVNILLLVTEYPAMAAILLYLALGWRRSEKQQQERFALLLAGVAALVLSQVIPFIVFIQFGQLFSQSHPLLIVGELLSGVVAPLLLTHAILRHRVFDLGFILNRTLVYGTVSAILLMSFGLVEWGVDHFVNIEGRERNALVDAAIALGVYLLFHKFRHTTEHRLEAFFFREWHAREATLRRSVAKAGFITAHQPLILAATQAFEQFSGGATVRLYLKDESGEYAPCDSSGPAIDRDAPLVVEMRAEPNPHRLEGAGPDGADLALPMVHRNELLGFVLLGAKPDNSDYRTDEVDLLGWAAHQLGLDLHALNVDRLEAIVRDQNQQIKIFQAIDARYRSNVSNPN